MVKSEVWKGPEKRVLILFVPFIGDFLMYLDFINILVEKYDKEGYQVDAALLKQNKSLVGNYCVMAPGASKTGKRWEAEKFAKVVEHITEQYGLDVFIVPKCRVLIALMYMLPMEIPSVQNGYKSRWHIPAFRPSRYQM